MFFLLAAVALSLPLYIDARASSIYGESIRGNETLVIICQACKGLFLSRRHVHTYIVAIL